MYPTMNQQTDYKQERPAPETLDSDQDSENSENRTTEVNEHVRMPKA